MDFGFNEIFFSTLFPFCTISAILISNFASFGRWTPQLIPTFYSRGLMLLFLVLSFPTRADHSCLLPNINS